MIEKIHALLRGECENHLMRPFSGSTARTRPHCGNIWV